MSPEILTLGPSLLQAFSASLCSATLPPTQLLSAPLPASCSCGPHTPPCRASSLPHLLQVFPPISSAQQGILQSSCLKLHFLSFFFSLIGPSPHILLICVLYCLPPLLQCKLPEVGDFVSFVVVLSTFCIPSL